MECGLASSTRGVETSQRRALCRIQICRPMFRLSTWEGTATRWCTRPANTSKLNLFAFLARLNAATVRMEELSATECNLEPGFGKMARRRILRCGWSKAIRNFRCNLHWRLHVAVFVAHGDDGFAVVAVGI